MDPGWKFASKEVALLCLVCLLLCFVLFYLFYFLFSHGVRESIYVLEYIGMYIHMCVCKKTKRKNRFQLNYGRPGWGEERKKTGQVGGRLFKAAQPRVDQGKAGRGRIFLLVHFLRPLCAVECGHVMAIIVVKHMVSLVVGQKAVALPMCNLSETFAGLHWDGFGAWGEAAGDYLGVFIGGLRCGTVRDVECLCVSVSFDASAVIGWLQLLVGDIIIIIVRVMPCGEGEGEVSGRGSCWFWVSRCGYGE